MKSFNLPSFLLGMAVVALLGLIAGRNLQAKIDKFKSAVATADARRAVADTESSRLLSSLIAADSAKQVVLEENVALKLRVATLGATVTKLQGTLAGLDSAVQADSACWRLCQPSIAARDTIIRLTGAQRDSALAGLARTEVALTRMLPADSVQAVIALKDSTIASYKRATDLAPTSSSLWAKLKPDVGVGGWAGYDIRFHDFGYGVALTFDWSLF